MWFKQVDQGAPETVQLPHHQAIELSCPCVQHELIERGAAGLRTAVHVLIDLRYSPPLPFGVRVKFP